jgi:hypothetical protein
MRRQNAGDIVIGFASVNHSRLPRFCRQRQLSLEGAVLQRSRGMIVVEIQTGLSRGNDAGISQDLAEPGFRLGAPLVGIVGMHSRGGNEPRLRGCQGEGAFGAAPGFADNHYPGHAGRPGPLEHLRPVGGVSRIGQVAVGIDQQA